MINYFPTECNIQARFIFKSSAATLLIYCINKTRINSIDFTLIFVKIKGYDVSV